MTDINDNLFFQHKRDIEEQLETELNKAALIIVQYKSGSISKILSAKRGNISYANLIQGRMDSASRQMKEQLDERGGSILKITLTGNYDTKNMADILDSWKRMKKNWQPFYRWLKHNGFSTYIAINEAHEKGGCHIHLTIYCKNKLEAKIDKERMSRLADKKFEREIKGCWRRCSGGGICDIQVVDDLSGVTAYISKELGRESHIEKALKRSIRDWQNKGDEKQRSADIKKLWGWYIADVLKLRRWNMSRDLKVEPLGKDVIGNSIQATASQKVASPVINYFIVPFSDLKAGLFSRGWGKVWEDSPEYCRAMYYFSKYPQEHRLPQDERERECLQARIKILKRLNERKRARAVA